MIKLPLEAETVHSYDRETYAIWRMDAKGVSRLMGKTHYESAAKLMVEKHASTSCYTYAVHWLSPSQPPIPSIHPPPPRPEPPCPTYAFGSIGGKPLTTKDARRALQQFLQTK